MKFIKLIDSDIQIFYILTVWVFLSNCERITMLANVCFISFEDPLINAYTFRVLMSF